MKLGPIALKIRQADTRFGDRVSGIAELNSILVAEGGQTLNADTLFVVHLGDTASENAHDSGISQKVSESFAVIAAVANDGRYSDRSGIEAVDLMHDVRDEIWRAILGWEWPNVSDDRDHRQMTKVSYNGAAIIEVTSAWVWMEFDFVGSLRISDSDGVTETDAVLYEEAWAQFKKPEELPMKAGTKLPLDDDDVLAEARAYVPGAFSFDDLPPFVSQVLGISYSDGEVYGDIATGSGYAWFKDEVTVAQFERFAVHGHKSKFALVVTDSAGKRACGYIGKYLSNSPMCGSELLLNPSFETWDGADDPADWIENGDSAPTKTVSEENVIVQSGSSSLKMVAAAGDGATFDVRQYLAFTDLIALNARYRIDVYRYVTAIDAGIFEVDYDDAFISIPDVEATTIDSTWALVSRDTNAKVNGNNRGRIRLLNNGSTNATCYWDNCSIKRIQHYGLAIKAVPKSKDSRGWYSIDSGFDATDIVSYAVYPV